LWLREIGTGVNGPSVGQTNHVQRPTSFAGHELTRIHIDHIDIGSLFTIYLYIYEGEVHDFGRFMVLETFAFHYMTPVAGGIANAHKYQFVFFFGGIPNRFRPRIPFNGIVGMLQ
jgi:hypothetical protein